MEWLPNTIDALTRLYQQAGALGFLAFVAVIGLMAILWRHLGQLIPLATSYVENNRKAALAQIDKLSEIEKTNAQIARQTDSDAVKRHKQEVIEAIAARFQCNAGLLMDEHRRKEQDKEKS